jgi:putative FmdB family regulatory protein
MPIYEYKCQKCKAESSVWFRSFAAAASETPVCTICGSKRLKRLLSAPARLYAGQGPAGTASTPPGGENPQALAQAMHEAAHGRDMGSEFNEVVARLEKGEKSKVIENSLRKRAGQKRGTH